MNTTGFHCPWDSGQVGWISVTKEKALKELGETEISDEFIAKVKERLKAEIAVYDQYLTGDIYGFILEDPDNGVGDSCWGFYGDDPRTNGMSERIDEKYHELFDLLR